MTSIVAFVVGLLVAVWLIVAGVLGFYFTLVTPMTLARSMLEMLRWPWFAIKALLGMPA